MTGIKASHHSHDNLNKERNSSIVTAAPSKASPRMQNTQKYDSVLLFVHGIGNQKEGDVLKKTASPVAKQIIRIAEKYGWHTEKNQETLSSPITITSRKQRQVKTMHLDECIWSNSFPRLTFWEFVKWVAARISSPIVLLTPNKDDIETICNDFKCHNFLDINAHLKLSGVIFRFLFRLFLFIGIILIIITSALLSLQFLKSSSTGVRMIVLLFILVATGCLVSFHKKVNYFAHVPAATMPSRRQDMLDTVINAMERTCKLTRHPTLIAHSQGGFLAYNALKNFSTKKSAKWRLFGVGSGLRPITFLDRLNNRWVLALWWVVSLYAFLAIASLLILLQHADFGWNLRFLGIQLYSLSRAFLGLPLSATQIDHLYEPLRQQSYNIFPQVFSEIQAITVLSLATAFVVIFGVIVKQKTGSPLLFDGISSVKNISNWKEVSTSHDLVGRLSLTPLPPQAKQQDVSGPSNVLLDHVSYFNTSILPIQIAIEALGDAGVLNKNELDKERNDINALNTQLNMLSQRRWHLTTFIIAALSFFLFVTTLFRNGPMSWTYTVVYLSLTVTILSVPCRIVEITLSKTGPLKPPSGKKSKRQIECITKHHNGMFLVGRSERILGSFLAIIGIGSILATYVAQNLFVAPGIKLAIDSESILNMGVIGITALFSGVAFMFRYRPQPFLLLGFEFCLGYRIATAPSEEFLIIKPGLPAAIFTIAITSLIVVIQVGRLLTQRNSAKQRD